MLHDFCVTGEEVREFLFRFFIVFVVFVHADVDDDFYESENGEGVEVGGVEVFGVTHVFVVDVIVGVVFVF